jgi:plasmid stability protein
MTSNRTVCLRATVLTRGAACTWPPHGRSTEAEIREVLATAVKPQGRVKLGSLLADLGRKARLTDEEFTVFETVRLDNRWTLGFVAG